MTPLLDQILVGLLIAAALGFFLFRFLRKGKKGCDAGCCGSSSQAVAPKVSSKVASRPERPAR